MDRTQEDTTAADLVEDMRRLGQRSHDLMIDIHQTEDEIRDVKRAKGSTRDLQRIRQQLIDERRRVEHEIRMLGQMKSDLFRRQSLALLGDVSTAAALRSLSKRIGIYESMFTALARNVDTEWAEYDWRVPVRKAMKQLREARDVEVGNG